MIKNKKQNKKPKKRVRTKAEAPAEPPIKKSVVALFLLGLVLIFVAVYLILAFISYIYTGAKDFSQAEGVNLYEYTFPLELKIPEEIANFHNMAGALGAKVSYYFINNCFGLASFFIPVYLIMVGMRLVGAFKVRLMRNFSLMALLMVWGSVVLGSLNTLIPGIDGTFLNFGGNHGKFVSNWLVALIGYPGLYGILILCGISFLIYFSSRTLEHIRVMLRMRYLKKVGSRIAERLDDDDDDDDEEDVYGNGDVADGNDNGVKKSDDRDYMPKSPAQEGVPLTLEFGPDDQVTVSDGGTVTGESNATAVPAATTSVDDLFKTEPLAKDGDKKAEADAESGEDALARLFDEQVRKSQGGEGDGEEEGEAEFDVTAQQTEQGDGNIERGSIDTPYDPKLDLEHYKYPPTSLLNAAPDAGPQIDMAEQQANKEQIIRVLHSFNVEISSIKATIGPTITLYEITPVEGTRISKIRNLEDDIALSLAAEGIRIIAPMPGKGTIGIEVPNKRKCVVSMESVIASKTYQESTMELPCALGKTITNEVFMFDLAKAPHVLVAGATGQGKSVGLNAIVTSLLYKKHPSELKFVMVDPKKVEFSIYSPIEKHFLAKLEDEEEAIITDTDKVVNTLNSLCQLMDTRYDMLKKAGVRNVKEYNALFKSRKLNPNNGHEYMPYIVVIIDEFGDLIMTAGKQVELPICRIAQLARAVGIHMIIATQRPTTQIISGTIKTNFPTRIAFKVSAMIDSRVILDRAGANQLIGRGDLLYLQGAEPVRVQCAFVDTPEVSDICKYIYDQQSPLHPMYLPEVLTEDGGADSKDVDLQHLDSLFADASRLVVSKQQGSTSLIQRQFSIGYNRAGRLMDQIEKAGIVGPQIGSKPREVLIQDLLTLDSVLNSLGVN